MNGPGKTKIQGVYADCARKIITNRLHSFLFLFLFADQTMNRLGSQQLKKQPAVTSEIKKTSAEENENENSAAMLANSGNCGPKEDEDVYEFKGTPKDNNSSGDDKSDVSKTSEKSTDEKVECDSSKRAFNEVDDAEETAEDENKRKKRKEDTKDAGQKSSTGVRIPIRQEKGSKIPGPASKTLGTVKTTLIDRKSPVPSPKPKSNSTDSDGDDDKLNEGPKVPPLKIVIPQGDQETGATRNGKNTSTRNQALPYVVASSNNSNDSTADKDSTSSRCTSPVDPIKIDEKPVVSDAPVVIIPSSTITTKCVSERQPRVLRSTHRGTGGQNSGSADRSSNNSSPQLQNSASPSEISGSANADEKTSQNNANISVPVNQPADETGPSATSSSTASQVNNNELHPRKRKIRASKEQQESKSEAKQEEKTIEANDIHPHDQPTTNSYQMYMNLRKQIDRRIWGLFPGTVLLENTFKIALSGR